MADSQSVRQPAVRATWLIGARPFSHFAVIQAWLVLRLHLHQKIGHDGMPHFIRTTLTSDPPSSVLCVPESIRIILE